MELHLSSHTIGRSGEGAASISTFRSRSREDWVRTDTKVSIDTFVQYDALIARASDAVQSLNGSRPMRNISMSTLMLAMSVGCASSPTTTREAELRSSIV